MVDDIAQLILPHAGDDDWTRWDGRWAPWRPGHAAPPAPPFANVTEFGAYGRDVEIQVRCGQYLNGFILHVYLICCAVAGRLLDRWMTQPTCVSSCALESNGRAILS